MKVKGWNVRTLESWTRGKLEKPANLPTCQPTNLHSLSGKLKLMLAALPLLGGLIIQPAIAQTITPDGSTSTKVTPEGNHINITEGQLSSDGANLFHSFDQFGLDANQIANFLSNPSIQNILSRVTGGDASFINGLIQVTGGNSNLFLMNPAGIVFGSTARLDVPASFTATTATGIGLGNNWFNATGANNYAALVGMPNLFDFNTLQPGVILNSGELSVKPEQNLTLIGGTVVSSGKLEAPGGQVTIATVPGSNALRLSQNGHLLSLEISPSAALPLSPSSSLPFTPLSLPQLLTGGNLGHATGLVVNSNGQIELASSASPVGSGDIVARTVTAETALLSASSNLNLVETQLQTTGDTQLLAQDTVRVRDSATNPFIAKAGGNLTVQGNQDVNLFALNHPESGLFSGKDMVLRSANTVSGDAHYMTGGSFRIEQLDGSPGNLFSPYDPVILANGDVTLQGYNGASLHILAGGSVNIAGDVTITGTDTANNTISPANPNPFLASLANVTLSDGTTLVIDGSTQPTLDIRAGINWALLPGFPGDTDLNNLNQTPGAGATGANIAVGTITNNGGVVLLTNQYNPNTALPGGTIQASRIDTRNLTGNGGSVTIDSRNSINVPLTLQAPNDLGGNAGIDSSSNGGNAGNITLNAVGLITVNSGIRAGESPQSVNDGNITINGGNITINAKGPQSNITVGNTGINTRGQNGGNITLNADGTMSLIDVISDGIGGKGGNVSITAGGNISHDDIRSRGTVDGGSIAISSLGGSIEYNPNGDNGGVASCVTVGSNFCQSGTSGDVTLSAPNGTITLAGAALPGGAANPDPNNTGAIKGRNVTLNSPQINLIRTGLITATGELSIEGNIVTASSNPRTGQAVNITINSNLNLDRDLRFTTAGGNITFNGTIDGNQNLTLNAGAGTTTFNSVVGGETPLNILSTNPLGSGTTIINSNLSANQLQFNNAVTLNNNSNLTANLLTFNNTLAVQSNSILTAEEIDFGGIVTANGTNLVLQPLTPNQDITIAGTQNNTNALDLTASELAQLQLGSGSLTIGRNNGEGDITINTSAFNNAVRIQSPQGTIAVNGEMAGTDDITLSAETTTLNAGITSQGGNILFDNSVVLGADVAINSNGGNVTFGGTVDGTRNLSLNSGTGTTTFQDSVGGSNRLNSLTTDAGGTTSISDDVRANRLNFQDNVNLLADLAMNANNINFGSTVNGNGTTLALGPLNASRNFTVTAASNFNNFNSLSIGDEDGSGAIALNGNFTFNFNEPVNIQAPSEGGSIATNGTIAGNAAIDLRADQNITTGDIKGSAIALTSEEGSITSGNLDTSGANGGSIEVNARNQIQVNDVNSSASEGTGGEIILDSDESSVQSGNLNSSGVTGGGSIEVNARNQIQVDDVNSSASEGTGGEIILDSDESFVQSGNLNSSGVTGGGQIDVNASTEIQAGVINSSATQGDGGDVSLDPEGNIAVASINAQGGTTGTGGDVDIETQRFFTASSTFLDSAGRDVSILATGGNGGGAITIQHRGGPLNTPFTVGSNYNNTNGTAGAIITGTSSNLNSILSGSYPARYDQLSPQGNIGLITRRDIIPIIPDGPGPVDPDNPVPPPQTPAQQVIQENQLPQLQVEQSLPPVEVDPVFGQVDEVFTRQFEFYLGRVGTQILTLNEARGILQEVEESTGVKPALIYVVFVPSASALDSPSLDRGNDELELLLVTSSGQPIRKRVGVTRNQVLKVADEFRSTVTNVRDADDYLASAKQLYQWLVAPLENDLQAQGIDNLAFLMDSGLRSIAIAALHDGQQFLVERYSVALMPSLSLTDSRYQDIKESQVLAMGAEKFTDQRSLPAVPVELSVITQQLWQGKAFLDNAFTLDNLKAQRARQPFGIIHLATHANFVPGAAKNSYIQLWDSKLSLDQLPELGWNKPPVNLLVLSACRTALGDEQAELGFAGVAVQSGAKSALASLWYVSDEGTLALMTNFYDQLRSAPIKAEALRRMQVEMIGGQVQLRNGQLKTPRGIIPLPPQLSQTRIRDLGHPYYWASFTLIGNPW